MNKKTGTLILIIGIIVSISAALYSIIGLSHLFSGAKTEVMIMATSLELAKLIITGTLKVYWDFINLKLKSYLIVATVILMLITSMGIYGFLSSAYQNVYQQNNVIETKLSTLDEKEKYYSDLIKQLKDEKTLLLNNSKELTNNYSIQNEAVDSKGNKIKKVDNKSQSRIDNRLDKINTTSENINVKIYSLNDSITKIQEDKFKLKTSSTVSEIGPLKYIAKITNIEIDSVVNYLILLIIFVFDPLAIALLILGIQIFNIKDKETNERTETIITENNLRIIEDETETNDDYSEDKETEIKDEVFVDNDNQRIIVNKKTDFNQLVDELLPENNKEKQYNFDKVIKTNPNQF